MTNEAKHFTSSRAFADFMQAALDADAKDTEGYTTTTRSGRTSYRRRRLGYFSSQRETDAGITILKNGEEKNIPEANKLLHSLQQRVQVRQHTWQHSIAGAFPDVPAFLAGEPENMWLYQEKADDRSPLRVYVGLTSSAGITEKQLTERGTVIAAFAMVMAQTRPVYITPYVNLGSYSHQNALVSWDMHTSPFILSELLGSLSAPEITRHVGITACYAVNPNVSGAWHDDYADEDKMRKHLGAKPADLYLPSIYLYDPILADPIAWLKDKVAKYTDNAS